MPPINPCGLAVEWMRSCHRGTWRFYENRPDVETTGRYYFLDDDAPHLGSLHSFGSCVWRAGIFEDGQQIGEIAGRPRPWQSGALTIRIPPRRAVGRLEEFAQPIAWPFPLPVRSNIEGIDSRCFSQANIPLATEEEVFGFESASLQMAYIQIVIWLYEDNHTAIENFIHAWLGPTATVQCYVQQGNIPPQAIVVTSEYSIVFSAGTQTLNQGGLQAFEQQQGPVDVGGFSTSPLFNVGGTAAAERLMDNGYVDGTPIVAVGHSYGGAVLSTLIARTRLANPSQRLGLFTFGTQKPGDHRMIALLDRVKWLALQNTGDPVPILPPNSLEMQFILWFIGGTLFARYAAWRQKPNITMIELDGTTLETTPRTLDSAVLLEYLLIVLGGGTLNPIEAHFSTEYLRRLSLRHPLPVWPMNETLWMMLFGPAALGERGVVIGGGGGGGELPAARGGVVIGGGGGGGELPAARGGVVIGGS